MLDHLLEVNRLRPEFKRYGLQEKDIDFIKEMIAGPLPKKEDKGKKEEVCLNILMHEIVLHIIA